MYPLYNFKKPLLSVELYRKRLGLGAFCLLTAEDKIQVPSQKICKPAKEYQQDGGIS